ncbi:DNA polymerase, partial [Operophtera brumata]
MPSDPTLFYARHLIKHNFVLWCSSLKRPDLGGRETDDNRLVSEVEELAGCSHNAPGAYNSVCVELESDAAAFKILRTMIASWLRDVTQFKNVFADYQISHFYRRTLYNLMKRLFLMLVAEFKRLGSVIVYADFNKILLSTKKNSVIDGIGKLAINTDISPVRPGPQTDTVQPHEETVPDARRRVQATGLRHSVRGLQQDTTLHQEELCYRWYRRTLYNLVKRLFLMLVAEFKRLGSVIVYADFNKILLCTKKNSVIDGIGKLAINTDISPVRPGPQTDSVQPHEETVPDARRGVQATGLRHSVRGLQQDTALHQEELCYRWIRGVRGAKHQKQGAVPRNRHPVQAMLG